MNNNTLNAKSNITSAEAVFDYRQWRKGFILTILRIASVLGVALIISSFPTSSLQVRILYIVMYALLLAVTFLPLGYNVRAYTFLAILFAVGINALLAWGPLIDGSLFLLLR